MQAIISEKSGLIESAVVWFLNGIIRSHGFDHTSLMSFIAKSVTPQSWRVGDIVTHKSTSPPLSSTTGSPAASSMIGRVVADSSNLPASSSTTINRQHSTVAIEFISRDFADAVGVKLTNTSTPSIETRRVKTSKLVHTTAIHGSSLRFPSNQDAEAKHEKNLVDHGPAGFSDSIELFSTSLNEKVPLDIEAIRCLDRAAIEVLARQCRKSSDTLASMFAAGLPDAIMEAISIIERQMNSLEPKDELPDNLTALGNLAVALTEQLYGSSLQLYDQEDMETDENDSQTLMPWQNAPRNVQNREQVRSQARSNVNNVGQRQSLREEGDSQLLATLHQRQNMLVSMISRASRVNGSGASDGSEVVFEPFGQIPHVFAQPRSSSPFRFDGSNDLLDYDQHEQARSFTDSPLNLADETTLSDDKKVHQNIDEEKCEENSLYPVLRCYGSISSVPPYGTKKQGGAAFAVFVRHLILCGVIFNSAQWTEALIVDHIKKYHTVSQLKTSSILRGVVDDEGTPILILAIKLGCSVDLISRLIKYGVSIGRESVIFAAATNQPKTLLLLLQHTAYEEGSIDLELCSPEIRRLLILIKSRQVELSKRMEDTAGGFMARLLVKLMEVGLSSRQMHTPRIDKCSKIICEILVGNVLLRALQGNYKATSHVEDGTNDVLFKQFNHPGVLKNERYSTRLSQGLLGALPPSLYRDFLFADVGNITKFFLLCEDYLCTKDMADVASGLTFLSLTLSKFPQIKSSSEMDRFGICEFVSNHKVLSSNRIADILSKELNIGLDVSATLSDSNDTARCTEVASSVVLCPKKHKTTVHITPHSSFRCDICTFAVPKGEYMFGCRQCDYDECLHCTLRNEKRTLSVQMVIRELASECYRTLSGEGNDACKVTDRISDAESAQQQELKSLNLRLLQRDVLVMKDLGNYLNIPGRITIHEFLTIILPSLHASMVGHTANNDGEKGHKGTNHRSKKARASRGATDDFLDSRMKFYKEALRQMISNRMGMKCNSGTSSVKTELNDKLDSALFEEDFDDDDDIGDKLDLSRCPGLSELLRRLHQIITFYENVPVLTASNDKASVQNSAGGNGDLHELIKPLGIMLLPFYENSGTTIQSVIYAEPLIPLAELQLHVIRAHRISDDAYISYCQWFVNVNVIATVALHAYSYAFCSFFQFIPVLLTIWQSLSNDQGHHH